MTGVQNMPSNRRQGQGSTFLQELFIFPLKNPPLKVIKDKIVAKSTNLTQSRKKNERPWS